MLRAAAAWGGPPCTARTRALEMGATPRHARRAAHPRIPAHKQPIAAPPPRPPSYIKACLGGPTPAEHEAVLAENEALKGELAGARAELAALQSKVGPRPKGAPRCAPSGAHPGWL